MAKNVEYCLCYLEYGMFHFHSVNLAVDVDSH